MSSTRLEPIRPLGEGRSSGFPFENREKAQKRSGEYSRILIVEDEMLVAENIKEILQENHYDVVGIISSGEEAITRFATLNPDLVLMDIHLSGAMNGIQTAIVIHYTLKQVPVLFLTAYGEEQIPPLIDTSSLLYDYLTKPYAREFLVDCIKQLLTRAN